MLRTLLAERFQLKWHLETKSLPVYVLGVDNRTLKLTNVEAGSGSVIRVRNGRIQAERITMSRLALAISSQLRRAVIDRTGLHGVFNMEFEWATDEPGATKPEEKGVAERACYGLQSSELCESWGCGWRRGKNQHRCWSWTVRQRRSKTELNGDRRLDGSNRWPQENFVSITAPNWVCW